MSADKNNGDDEGRERGFVKEIRKQSADFPGWYNDVVRKAQLADNSPVAGSMIIRPYGYALWENIREPLVLRPTSETMLASVLRDYIQSYRDLPVLTNQWNNVFRWELRTRFFLRTREFLWQEGHTFHETPKEAEDEVARMLHCYVRIAEEWCAIPVLSGRKSETEKFAGAQYSTAIEGMMKDGKALQMGTSHYFGQNFTRAYELTFTGRTNEREHPYSTSWGMSTRMVGAVVMAHGDDFGLQLPPRVAPIQVVIVPIFRSQAERTALEPAIARITDQLAELRVKVDW